MTDAASYIMSGVTGAVYQAPAGTALPTATTTALNAAFVDLGYIKDDGVTQSISSDTNQIKAWQNGDIVAEYETSHLLQFKFAGLETNPTTLATYYGNYDGSGSEGVTQIKAGSYFRGRLIIDVLDGTNALRVVCPDAKVVSRDDVVYKNGDPISYGVTVTCFADSSGVKGYLYTAAAGAS